MTIEQYMHSEHKHGCPCRLTVSLLKTGKYRARLSFAPGMDTAWAEGTSVADAIEQLEKCLA